MNRTQRRRRRTRSTRTDIDMDFGLTMSDVMADLDSGWLARHGDATSVTP